MEQVGEIVVDTSADNNDGLQILDSYEAYGCRVNTISVNELFRRYERAGFLYPEKRQRLNRFWPLIRENWIRALRAGELIHYIITAELDDGAWASVTSWRSTRTGWHTQHLVGYGGPSASRAVMLAAQAVRIRDQFDGSHQSWFQRSNRFANKVFGSITSTLDTSSGWVGDYSYFAFPRSHLNKCHGPVQVRLSRPQDSAGICSLVDTVRSPVYSSAEGLNDSDLGLDTVDDLYRKVGLRRYRNVYIASLPGKESIAGLALAYRGPIGFNFSLLENRSDLILDPKLTSSTRAQVIQSLLNAAAETYVDFPESAIPVILDRVYVQELRTLGGTYIRDYAQSIWLQSGFVPWYRHCDRIYHRVMRSGHRRGFGATLVSQKEGAGT